MVANLMLLRLASGDVQPARVPASNGEPIDLGGALRRETALGNNETTYYSNNYMARSGNKLFTVWPTGTGAPVRFYEFFPTALSIILTGDPAGGSSLPDEGDIIFGLTSSATGTLVEDYITGDNFINYIPTNGTFVDGETVLITGSASGSNTATLAGSSNPINNQGEWGVAYTTTNNQAQQLGQSGLQLAVDSDNRTKMFYIFDTGSNNISVKHNSDTDQFTETDEGATTANADPVGSAGIVGNNRIFWVRGNTVGASRLQSYDPRTDSLTDEAATRTSRKSFVTIKGNVYYVYQSSSNVIFEDVTSGSAVSIDTFSSGSSGEVMFDMWIGPDDEAIYIAATRIGGGNENRILRYHFEDAALIRDSSTTLTDDDVGEALYPSALRTAPLAAKIWSYMDYETTPGTKILRIFYQSSVSTSADEYQWSNWSNLSGGALVTWNGTTGNSNDVVFPTNPGLSIGDWIRHNSTNRIFRVEAISGASNEQIEISAAGAATAPSTSSITSEAVEFSFTGNPTSNVGYSRINLMEDGGGHTYPGAGTSSSHAEIINYTDITAGERISFQIFTESGSPTVSAQGYFLDESGELQQMTLSAVSNGTLSGNTNNNLTADNGTTTYTFDWNANADGVTDADYIVRYIRIFTA